MPPGPTGEGETPHNEMAGGVPQPRPHRPIDGVRPTHEHEKIELLRRAMYSRAISPTLKDKPRRTLDPLPPSVGEDWKRPEPQLASSNVAPPALSLVRQAMRWMVALSATFFIGAVAFFAYYFFVGGGSTPASPGNIDISISGPVQIQSGEATEFQIAVVNRNRAPLELADLIVKYPDGTRSPTDLVTDLKSQRSPLGTIEPGGRRQGTVSAVFAGLEGEQANIEVELEYRLQGSSAIFVARKEYPVTFSSSPISLSVEGNSETISGQELEFKLTIASNADAPVRDVLLHAAFPFGFSLLSTSLNDDIAITRPSAASNSGLWAMGDFQPGQKKTVTVRGVLKGEQSDERIVRFIVGTRKSITDTKISATLADYAHALTVSRPFLDMNIAINKTEGGAATSIGPGELVTVTVDWQNNLQTAITDAVIVARLSGLTIDGSTVRTTDGFYRSSDRSVLWDKSTTRGVLGNVPAGAKGSVQFAFQSPSSQSLELTRDPKLTISVHAAGKRVSEAGVPEGLQATAVQNIRLASDLQLIAQGLYSGNPLGSSGPMPPKADEETTYGIVLSITNTTNEIKNAKVTAALPPNVRWVGIHSPSSAKISFNQIDSTFTWDVGTVEPGVGIGGTVPRQIAIVVGLTPSQTQIGSSPPLVRSIVLKGIDGATNVLVTREAQDVTTNIVGDPGFTAANATVVK